MTKPDQAPGATSGFISNLNRLRSGVSTPMFREVLATGTILFLAALAVALVSQWLSFKITLLVAFVVGLFGTFALTLRFSSLQRVAKHSEDLCRLTVDQPLAGIVHSDMQGNWTLVNTGFCKMLGYSQQELLGRSYTEVTYPPDLEQDRDLVERFLQGKINDCTVEKRFVAKNGRLVWVIMNAVLLRNEKSEPELYIATFQDITELKKTQEELEESNQQLADFAHVVSHDIREPLRGIANYAAIINEDYGQQLDDAGREMLTMLARLSKRQDKQIQSLLTYSRLRSAPLDKHPTDLNTVVANVKEDLAHLLEEHNASLKVSGTLPTVDCDARLVADVFSNLIRNGLQYNKADNMQIEIGIQPFLPIDAGEDAASAKKVQPVLYVRDNGIGILPEHQEKVFSLFKRLHSDKKYGPGSGMGLSLAYRIVQRHGGDMCLDSSLGEGSTFYFTLGEATDA